MVHRSALVAEPLQDYQRRAGRTRTSQGARSGTAESNTTRHSRQVDSKRRDNKCFVGLAKMIRSARTTCGDYTRDKVDVTAVRGLGGTQMARQGDGSYPFVTLSAGSDKGTNELSRLKRDSRLCNHHA